MIASALFLLLAASGTGKSADFLILEDPASLEILSRFEQALTAAEKKAIPPFAPLKVVEEKSLLGDGITSAMEVEFEGKAYYLPMRGSTEKPPAVRRHRGCRSEEGQERQAGADISCTRGAAPGGRSATLRKGEAVSPVFTCGSQSYVKKPAARSEYLWCPAGGPYAAKEKIAATPAAGPGPDLQALQARLGPRLEAANAAYAEFTQAFNGLTGETRKPPRWDCGFSEGGMRCRLEGGHEVAADDLEKSTAVLVRDLRNSLTGKPFEVAATPEGIEVSPRAEGSPSRP